MNAKPKYHHALPDRGDVKKLTEELARLELDINTPSTLFTRLPNSLAALRMLGDASAISREAAKRLHEIQKLPAFLRLLQDPNFSKALSSFRTKAKQTPEDEVRFLVRVVFYIFRYLIESEQPELVRQPDARTRSQTAATVRKLQQLAKKGARLENLQDQTNLEILLARLESQLGKKPDKRPRNDQALKQRLFVKRLASDFLSCFAQPLTTVLGGLAAVVGYEPGERNIDHIVSEAKKEHRRRQRDALAKILAKSLQD